VSVIRWKDGIDWWMRFDAATVEEVARDAEISTYPVETGAILSDHYQPQPRRILLTGVVSDTPSGPNLTGVVSDTPSGPNWTNLTSGAGTRAEKASQPLMRPASVKSTTAESYAEQARRGPVGILRPISTTVLPSRRLVRANIERAAMLIPKPVVVLRAVEGGAVNRITTFVLALDALMEQRIPVTIVLSGGLEFKDMMITSHSSPRVAGSGGSIRVRMDLQQVIAADAALTVKESQTRADPAVKPKKAKGNQGTSWPKGQASALLNGLADKGFTIR
jgi:hypothetical protein